MTERPDWRVLAPRLRAAREAAGLTIDETCERTGISRAGLYAYEAGKNEPKTGALLALCAAYNIDPRELAA